jgi:photosystem II stability/assembly factor-like uncharacterized protein
MPYSKAILLISVVFILISPGCVDKGHKPFSKVFIQDIVKDSTLNVRAIDFNKEFLVYGSKDHFGKISLNEQIKINISDFNVSKESQTDKFEFKKEDGSLFHFRAVEEVNGNVFALSIESPAKLYKLKRKSKEAKLVYEEKHPKAFYDALAFWNDKEGIAMGDPTEACISIIITRDAGETWQKLPCSQLPKAVEGEAAFAASDTNIAIVGEKTWIATGGVKSHILYSPDKGKTWQNIATPIIQGQPTTGLYSIDFYDEEHGFGIGGDYTKPDKNTQNKILTVDGGKTWQLVADGKAPGYRSCVQYVPNSDAKALVSVGFKGIDYSQDGGKSWRHLSDESFYTIRFINENEAFAAGKAKISKLIFK